MKYFNSANTILLAIIALVLFTSSCKTVQYQELGSFGGGSMTAKQSVTNSNKIEANNETEQSKSTSSESVVSPKVRTLQT